MWGRSVSLLAGDNAKGHPAGTKTGDVIHIFQSGSIQMVTDPAIDAAGDVWAGNNWISLEAAASPNPSRPTSTWGGGPGFTVIYGVAAPEISFLRCTQLRLGYDTEHATAPMEISRSTQRDRVFRFGPFELSECEGNLRKNGVRIKLQEQPFRVLLELVASPGKVVAREELQQKLWPADTFVDFDVGLNTAIRKLRQALNDDADHPHYIETLAKRDHRFLAPVTDTAAKGSELRSQPVSGAALTVEGFPEGKGESIQRVPTACSKATAVAKRSCSRLCQGAT